jgi:Cof subfamily protein (haloacid dehalogenase superfamily)
VTAFAAPRLDQVALPAHVGLVALDLDGTCLDRHQQLHPRTQAAVQEAGRRVPVVIATGRMYRSTLPWARRLGVRAPLLCYQGALVQAVPDPDPGDGLVYGRLIFTAPLAGDVAVRAIAIARREGWHRQGYVDDTLLCEENRPEAWEYAGIGGVPIEFVSDLAAAVGGGSTKVVCVVDDPEEAKRCRAVMSTELGDAARVTPSLPQFIEITNPDAGKASALRRLCAELGVDPGHAVAVGDAPNDIDMLEAVGFAVAVESAPEELLRHADCICPGPEAAGVADVLVALGLAGTP